jgi:hypothetical protein
MAIELARIRLRGGYALAAGLLLLVGIWIFASAFLAVAGYGTAAAASARTGDLGALLAWSAYHPGTDRAFHLLELVPFVLAMLLPPALQRTLWPRGMRGGLAMRVLGQIGFGGFALALLLGLLTTGGVAAAYLGATAAQRPALVASYVTIVAWQNLLAYVLGAGCLAISLLLAGVRIVRTGLLPGWFGVLSLVPAALLAALAVTTLTSASPVRVPLATPSVDALAIWLILVGGLLLRLDGLPVLVEEDPADTPEGSAAAPGDTASGASHSAAATPNPQ